MEVAPLSWPDLRSLDTRDPSAVAAARSTLVNVFEVVRSDLRAIVEHLAALGYVFHGEPLPGCDLDRYRSEQRPLYVERSGDDPPLALDVFWEVVGPVDLVGEFRELLPRIHSGSDSAGSVVYADPLVVYDPAEATRETYWQRWNGGQSDDTDAFVDICQDAHHKAGFSGGDPVLFRLPASPDPVLVDSAGMWPDGVTFTHLIATAMAWAGLPGLRHADPVPPWSDLLRQPYTAKYHRDDAP